MSRNTEIVSKVKLVVLKSLWQMTQPPPSLAVGTVTNLALVSYYSLMSIDVMAAIRAGTGLGPSP